MSTIFLTILFAIISVAFMFLALSITRIRKGHDIQGEVGENPQMRKLGLDCAIRDMEKEANVVKDSSNKVIGCGGKVCESCQEHICHK